MKVEISVTLSESVLPEIDRHAAKGANRSEFIETAVRGYIAALERRKKKVRNSRSTIGALRH